MKKICCFTITLLLIFLCGCSRGVEVLRNSQYSILEEHGEYSIKFHNPADVYSSGSDILIGTAEMAVAVEFTSITEMKQAIEPGHFSEYELDIIQSKFEKNSRGEIKICNTDKLYDVTLPDDVETRVIEWFGDSYIFLIGENCSLNFTDQSGYDECAKQNNIESGKSKIISVETIEDRNARVVTYESYLSATPRKMVTYSVASGGKTITVAERYNLNESDTVPFSINFWGNCDGAYFTGYIYELTERPSFEWVTSFGLTPYVETETE